MRENFNLKFVQKSICCQAMKFKAKNLKFHEILLLDLPSIDGPLPLHETRACRQIADQKPFVLVAPCSSTLGQNIS